MLPYLQPKKISSLIIASNKPEGGLDPKGQEGDEDAGLMAAAEDLIKAVHAKDATAVASALRSAQAVLDTDESEEAGE